MKSNYQSFECQLAFKEEMKAVEAKLRLDASVRRCMKVAAAIIGTAGIGVVAWVDWRLALGLFLFSWGENIFKKNRS